MDKREQKIVLERFLSFHGIEMLPSARLSHFGRRFSRFFPAIASKFKTEDEIWSDARIKSLAEYVSSVDPSGFRKDSAAANFKLSKKQKKINKTRQFLLSKEWKILRYEVLRERGRKCQCCGAVANESVRGGNVRIEVDHIKPISKFWHLRLDKKNLQVLCRSCNGGKSNRYQDDFRVDPAAKATAATLQESFSAA